MLSFKQQKKSAILFLPFLFIIASCSNPKSKLAEYGTVFQNVVLTDNGVFRSFNLGDSQDMIQKNETGKPIEVDKDYLYYEYKLDTIGSFNITYNFDDRGLNEIESDIFINKSSQAETVINKFKAYFDKHYGASESEMGFNIWTVKSEKYDVIKISLNDESADFTTDKAPAKISLWIYPENN